MSTRGGHIIYQDLAEPVVVQSESITVDKWYKDHPNPVGRRALQTAILAGSFFFVDSVSTSKIAAQTPEWHPQQNQPRRLVERLPRQHTGEFKFEVPRTILLTDWWQPIQQKYISKLREVNTGEFKFEVPRTILESDWHQPISQPYFSKRRDSTGQFVLHDKPIVPFSWDRLQNQPYFPKRRDVPSGEYRFEVPRTILISDWWQPLQTPIKQLPRQIFGGDTRTEVVSDAEVVTVDKWFVRASEPIRRKETRQTAGEFRFETPRDILLSDWWQPISQPYFDKRRFITSGEYRFEQPRQILVSDWYNQTSQPYFNKRRDSFGLFAFHDRPIVSFDWNILHSQPYFGKRRDVPSGEYRFEVPRAILVSDWYQPIQQPRIVRPTKTDFGEYRFEVPRTILVSDWFAPIQQPRIVKYRDSKFGGLLVEFSSPGVEVVTLDKWYQPISQPRIVKARNYYTGEFRFEIPRTILLTDWWQRTSEPVRRIPQRNFGGEARFEVPRTILVSDWFKEIQQPYFSQRRFITSGQYQIETPRQILLDWYQPLSEPVRRIVQRLTGGEFRTERSMAELITLDKWFVPISQPYFREKRQHGYPPIQFIDTTIIDWFMPIIQPYFGVRRNYFTGEYRFELPREIELPDWYQPIDQPYLQRFKQWFINSIVLGDIPRLNAPITPYYPFVCNDIVAIFEKETEYITSVIEKLNNCSHSIINKET